MVHKLTPILTDADRRYKQAEEHLLSCVNMEELRAVVSQEDSELEGGFLGFLENYEDAIRYIPSKDFTVIDIGCYLAVQSYLFTDYAQYIGVDVTESMGSLTPRHKMKRCCPPNAVFYDMYGQQFLKEYADKYDVNKCFVIMSAVPDFELADIVEAMFPNHYIAYPGEKLRVATQQER